MSVGVELTVKRKEKVSKSFLFDGHLLVCLMMMEIMRPYMPRIPAITTGMIDLKTSSGLIAQVSRMATPDLAVPKAAPTLAKKRAATHPAAPMPVAWLGSPRRLIAQ